MDPFYIMPVEMYEAILNELDDSLDKLNLVRTNSQLENAFHAMINDWQFEAVMPLIIRQCNFSTPFFNEEFLNCRLVSSGTCNAIDKYTEWSLKCIGYAPIFTNLVHCISSEDEAAKFLTDIEHHPPHRSPILSKSLMLDITLPIDIEVENGVYKQLVSKVGNHLSRIELDGRITNEVERSLNWIFKDLLTLTPNLRSLSLKFWDYDAPSRDLGNGIEDFMLPSLPNLEQLDVQTYCSAAHCLPLNFKLWFPGLTMLNIGMLNWKNEYNSENLFPKLERLSIDSIYLPGDDQGKVVQLLENFKAPPTFKFLALDCVLRAGNDSQMEEFNKCVDMLKTLALSTATNSHSECKRKWKAAVSRIGLNRCLVMIIKPSRRRCRRRMANK